MRLLETIQVGPRHAGHVRAIYAGRGVELWHETRTPWNPLERASETVEVFPGNLPAAPPQGAEFCGMQAPVYGGSDIAVIRWGGASAMGFALCWIRRNRRPSATVRVIAVQSESL